MHRPRILSSQERSVIDRPWPDQDHVRPHEWLTGVSRARYIDRLERKGHLELYVSKTASEKMLNHARRFGRMRREAMGFLLGDVCASGRRRFVLVRDIVTGALLSTPESVRFDDGSYSELFEELDSSGFDYIIVGWYHTHPGYGCFMSGTDHATQASAFHEDYHSAIVIDPIRKEIEAFRLKGRQCAHLDFGVFWHDLESPYNSARVKRIRVEKRRAPSPDQTQIA